MKLYILLVTLFSSLVVKQDAPFKQFHITGFAQGTTYSIIYYAVDSVLTKREVEKIFQRLDSSLSVYKSYSLINSFNRSAGGVAIDEHLQKVVRKALQVHASTGGAFDITVWPLVNAWGFGVQKIDAPPGVDDISRIMPCVGSNKIQFTGEVLRKQLPCVAIDVNGIAQGYSVDVLTELLEAKGVHNYLVEIGGEIKVKGRKQPSNEKMKIGLESPGNTPFEMGLIKKILVLDSGAITTSGNYLKFYESNGKHITHIIDPRTGFSVQNELISVTVFAKDAITADAYDNALMVMGLEKALQFATDNKEIEAYFIYRTTAGNIADTATKGFYKMMMK